MSLNNLDRIRNADKRTLIFGLLIVGALLFFEIFNFSTTNFALQDLLGEQKTFGIRWSMALSLAFCAIDFAGISRIFTPERGNNEPREIWYLFGAWMLAATMNASLTWWGVSMAILNHAVQSTAIMDARQILRVVPIFVAILVWVIRVLVIGSISTVGERILWGQTATRPAASPRSAMARPKSRVTQQPAASARRAAPARSSNNFRFDGASSETANEPMRIQSATSYPSSNAVPREVVAPRQNPRYKSAEPTYHSLNGLGNEVEGHTSQSTRNM